MRSKTRAQVYEDLKDLRRRGELPDLIAALDRLKTLVLQAEPARKVAKALKAKPARKVVRARPAKGSKQEQELFRVLEIQALADRVFGDEKKANTWLRRPNPSMSGQIPLDLMKDELGTAVVREALEQIDHGIFA